MDSTIFLFLVQDGTTNGALYALLALALVLVFAVTRVIFIPQGEFAAFGALTYAVPATGFLIGLKGFVAPTIAGLLSFPGAAVAALAVGIVEAFASFFASVFTEIIVFMLLVPVLLVRSVFSHAMEEDE